MSGSPAWHLAASGAMAGSRPAHPLSPALSGVNSSYFEEEEEEMSLLPPPGGPRSASAHDAACSVQHGAWRPPSSSGICRGRTQAPDARSPTPAAILQATAAAGPPTRNPSATNLTARCTHSR